LDLTEVQNNLGIEFKDPDLLLEALTHSSCLNEPSRGLKKHNEGLAWLGDALIHWVVSERIYSIHFSKEELTNQRKKHENEEGLAGLAVKYKLDMAMILPESQEKIGGRINQRNLHTVFEAIVGAIYKDQGFEAASEFVIYTIFMK